MFDPTWQPADWQQLARDPSATSTRWMAAQAQYLPDYVKTAEPVEGDALEALHDRQFALILEQEPQDGQHKTAHRLFPLPDAAHTWMAQEALRHTGHSLPPDARKTAAHHIAAAAERYGIPVTAKVAGWRVGKHDAGNRVVLRPEPVKTAQVPEQDNDDLWGVVEHGRRRYPLHTPELIKKAMDYLATFEDLLTVPQRYQLATKTAARAQQENIRITQKVAQYTYDGRYADTIATTMAARTDYARDHAPEAVGTLMSIGRDIDYGAEPWEVAAKVAQWDEQHGYDQHAERYGIPSAHESVLGGVTHKEAAFDPDTMELSDIDDRQWASIVLKHQAKLSRYLGHGMVDQILNHPSAVLPELPDQHQEAIKNIVAGRL